MIMDGEADRNSKGKGVPSGNTRLRSFASAMGLVDIWREEQPSARQYSYMVGSTGAMSRIDYTLTSSMSQHRFLNTRYLARGISDHAPLMTHIREFGKPSGVHWHLDPWELQDWNVRKATSTHLKNYFTVNRESVSAPVTLWEAHKMVVQAS